MIQNILLKGLYKFTKNLECQPGLLQNNFDTYKNMQELSIVTYRKNLLGNWRLVLIEEDKETIHGCFISALLKIKAIWHDNFPCNIFYTDADTLCVHPLDIFGKFNDFRLFADSDPVERGKYINGGVKYFPSTLIPKFWDDYTYYIDNWDYNHWAYDQNFQIELMLLQENFDSSASQSWVVKQIGFSHKQMIDDLGCNKFDHAILHFHSSQNPLFRLECMKNLWRRLND